MEWFDCSIPLCSPEGFDLSKFNAMEDVFHINSKAKSLAKIGLNALQQRFWMPSTRRQM
jgi:hypothetical protein